MASVVTGVWCNSSIPSAFKHKFGCELRCALLYANCLCRKVGEELAKCVPAFSLDVVGLTTEYAREARFLGCLCTAHGLFWCYSHRKPRGVVPDVNAPAVMEFANNELIVADRDGLKTFTSEGKLLQYIDKPMGFLRKPPWGIAVSSDGTIFVGVANALETHTLSKTHAAQMLSKDLPCAHNADMWSLRYNDGLLYASAFGRVDVFNTNRELVRQIPLRDFVDRELDGRDLCFHNGEMFVSCNGSYDESGVKVYNKDGMLVREPVVGLCGAMAVTAAGQLFIADPASDEIVLVDAKGKRLLRFGGYGQGSGFFKHPAKVCVGPEGMLYVSDAHCISAFVL